MVNQLYGGGHAKSQIDTKIDEDFQSTLSCSPRQLIDFELFYPMYEGKMALSAGRTLWAMRYIYQLVLIYSHT